MSATAAPQSPWLRVSEAAAYAKVGPKLLYREIRAGRLRAAVVGGRRDLRLRREFVDEWLMQQSAVREVRHA